MLSKSVKSLHDVERLRGGKTFWIETKLDGERMQLHKKGGNYRWFSRNAKDYGYLYGAYKDQKLAKDIHDCFRGETETCILDGEMMSYNESSGLFESFGALKTAANLFNEKGEAATSKPVFIVFDIVFYNGKSMLTSPLTDRYKLLKGVIREKKNKMEILPHVEGVSTEDVINALDASMLRHEEGIVIKDPESHYHLNDRSGLWLKVKPDYIDSLGDDLDLVVVGGFYGTGRRGGILSHFLCAVLDNNPNVEERKFVTFCKFGSGYTLAQIEDISHERSAPWQTYDHANPPSWLIHPLSSKERPDKVLHPSHSRVVTVKAAQVVESAQYGAGWTLRFPRFVKLRPDKGIEDALSQKGLEEYIANNDGRMQSRRFEEERGGGKRSGGSKSGAAVRSVATLAKEYLGAKLEKGEKVEDLILEGLEVCVIPGSVKNLEGMCLKLELEKRILKHGGKCVQNANKDTTDCVIAEKPTVKVESYKRAETCDIVKASWILDCIDAGRKLPLEPKYMIFTSKKTKRYFQKVNDEYGDSFTRDVTDGGLRELFKRMTGHVPLTSNKRKSLHKGIEHRRKQLKTIASFESKFELDQVPSEDRMFRDMCAYLDVSDTVVVSSLMLEDRGVSAGGQLLEGVLVVDADADAEEEGDVEEHLKSMEAQYTSVGMLEPEIRCRGGQVAKVLGPWTTHIVLATPKSDFPIKTTDEQLARENYFLNLLLHYPERHTRRPNIVQSSSVKEKMELLL
ncbi:DNA ligase (ATP) [Podochytrium sp. JEL0797]|nr:DNA ligase (ATP) [Podochytrium sp. JEL0797]